MILFVRKISSIELYVQPFRFMCATDPFQYV